MKSKISKKKKYLILGTIGGGVLAASVTTPIIILNNKNDKVIKIIKEDKVIKEDKDIKNDKDIKEDKVINKIVEILKNKSTEEKIIVLPSDAKGKIIADNKEKIIDKIKILIGKSNLKETKIEILMTTDAPISTISQDIIVLISKIDKKTIKTTERFQVKREFTVSELANKDIESIKTILDSKIGKDLIINLSSDSSGNIIGKIANKNAILTKLRRLIDPSNTNGEANHSSLKGTTIEVSKSTDKLISTFLQDIIVKISKGEGKTLTTTKTFYVKRDFTTNENILAVKRILDSKRGNDLMIILASNSTGNIIGKAANKNAILTKLRRLIDPSNTNGEANHSSLKGTTIEVSMSKDALISTSFQNIIVSVAKTGGTTLRTRKTFQVKRDFSIKEINEDIQGIKTILDAKIGDDLIITLPNNSGGNIIENAINKKMIEQELRKLIDPLNIYGEANHQSLLGTTIEVSINNDLPISTTPQNIIVTIRKLNRSDTLTKTFQVKREFTNSESIDKDIESVKKVLDAKTANDLIITLPSYSRGNIIGNIVNKNEVERKLRQLIDPLNTYGYFNHPSLRGTSVVIYMSKDAPISTIPQNIIVTIRKANRSHILTKTFQVKRDFTTNELINNDIESIKNILDSKTGDDLMIILPSDSTGNIIGKEVNKEAIKQKLRKLIDPLNTNKQANHPSLRGTTIEVLKSNDKLISTLPQDIIVKISKGEGKTLTTTKTFYVKRDFTNFEDVLAIQKILDSKTGNDLIITLPSSSSGDIINKSANRNAIIRQLRKLIDPSNIDGKANHPSLRGTTIEFSMRNDRPISTNLQNIIIFIRKTEIAGVITAKTFRVNKYDSVNQDIASIQKILDSKTSDDLKIILPSASTGNIIGKQANKDAIIRQLRKLIDSSNINGEASHASLLGTTIEVSMSEDASISTIFQNIIVSITKTGGTTLRTTKTFQVKRKFTANESILSIQKILDSKTGEDLKIILASDSTGNIIQNATNKNTIIKKLRKLIDPSNINGEVSHQSLLGTTIEVSMSEDASISTTFQNIVVSITKIDGITLRTTKIFQVKREFTNAEKITNYFANKAKKRFTIFGGEALNTKAKILAAIKKHLALDDPNLWTDEIQSLIVFSNDEKTNKIVKENYKEVSFSIFYDNDNKVIQNVKLKIKHLRTKIENKIIVNNLYDYYRNKWYTKQKALTVTLKRLNHWDGVVMRKGVNQATKNIYVENKVKFDLNGVFYSRFSIKPDYVPNDVYTIFSGRSLEYPRRFRVVLYSGKSQRIFRKSMNIFIKAVLKKELTLSQLNANKDIMAVRKILDFKSKENLIITLPSDSSGNIVGKLDNKNIIEKRIKELIHASNQNGDSNHWSLRETTITISMTNDAPISTSPQNIIVSISKTNGETLRTKSIFQVKRDFTIDEDIQAIKQILESKTKNDLIITLPSDSTGSIFKKSNENEIKRKLRKLIDPSNTNGDPNHPSLRGTSINIFTNDPILTTIPKYIDVFILKTGGTNVRITGIFQVKKIFNIDEDIALVKKVLDAKTGEDLIITLSSDSTKNIIGNAINKSAIERKLRELIDPSNTDGDPNHSSLRGTTIEVSMWNDRPISTIPQDIIVSIIKANGTTLTTSSIFQVKRDFTINELPSKDIASIKKVLDAKTGENLIITLPSDASGYIIRNPINRKAIERELRELIDPSNTNGDPTHSSLKGTTITAYMTPDRPILTTPQHISILISKTNGITLRIRNVFQVKREFTANEDIKAIKRILNSLSRKDRLIRISSDLGESIINNPTNKNAVERKVRMLIDPSNTGGDSNHPSLRGTKITFTKVNHKNDLISIGSKSINIVISKTGGKSVTFIYLEVIKL